MCSLISFAFKQASDYLSLISQKPPPKPISCDFTWNRNFIVLLHFSPLESAQEQFKTDSSLCRKGCLLKAPFMDMGPCEYADLGVLHCKSHRTMNKLGPHS